MNVQSTQRQELPRLLVTTREAAKMLGISERTLFTLSKDGDIPAVRFGESPNGKKRRAVRYDPRDLDAWIISTKGQRKGS